MSRLGCSSDQEETAAMVINLLCDTFISLKYMLTYQLLFHAVYRKPRYLRPLSHGLFYGIRLVLRRDIIKRYSLRLIHERFFSSHNMLAAAAPFHVQPRKSLLVDATTP